MENGLQNGLECVLRYIDFKKNSNERGVSTPSHALPRPRGFRRSVQDFGFQCPPPGNDISGSGPVHSPFILKIWSKNLILESIKGRSSVANLRKNNDLQY